MRNYSISILVITLLFFSFENLLKAQSDWELNPHEFEYSMNITGKVAIDGYFSVDENDMVAAFVDGECRGITKLKYEDFIDEYFIYLMIYGNTPLEKLTFKIFDASSNKIVNTKDTIDFVINQSIGSIDNPFIFSDSILSREAEILSFYIPDQVGGTLILGNNIYVIQDWNNTLTGIVPSFVLSDGAKAYINGEEQVSGATVNDFSSTVKYVITSADLSDTIIYNVHIIKDENDSPTEIILSNDKIGETVKINTSVATLSAKNQNSGDTLQFSLIAGNGINDKDNTMFEIVGNYLILKEGLNYEEQESLNILIRVIDNKGGVFEQAFILNVTDENDSPTEIILSKNVIEKSAKIESEVATLTAKDPDKEDTFQFNLTVGDGINDRENTMFEIIDYNLILKEELNYEEQESLNILIRVIDNKDGVFEQAFTLRVTDKNDAPEFLSTPANYIMQEEVYVYHVNVQDNDGDDVNISFENLPEWLIFNENTNLLTGVAHNEHVGVYQFSIKISDGNKETVQPVVISVLNINDPPEINYYLGQQYFYTGKENTIELPNDCIVDPDIGDELTFRLSTENNSALPVWLNFDPGTLTISGNPPGNERGVYYLKLTAADEGWLKEWLVFSLEVSFPTAIGNLGNNMFFRIFPNPVQNVLYVDIPMGNIDATISIINISGQVIKTTLLSPGAGKMVSMNGINSGVYFVKFQQGELHEIVKVIKQ